MREKFWSMYEQVKYSERYFFFYREEAKAKDRNVKIFLIVTSLSSIANLGLWEKIPFLWAIIALVAQVVSAILYLFPYSDQITALNYLLPELDHLLNQIDYDWDQINEFQAIPDLEINKLVLEYNEKYSNLEHRYTNGVSFPRNEKCDKKAQGDCEQFKYARFGIAQTNYLEEALNGGK